MTRTCTSGTLSRVLSVHVNVPGMEGTWIARALRDAEIEVSEERHQALEDAGVLVAELSAAGLPETLKSFDGEVLLIGSDSEVPEDFAAYAYVAKPFALEKLVKRVKALVSPGTTGSSYPSVRPSSGSSERPSRAPSEANVRPPSRPPNYPADLEIREPTMTLDEETGFGEASESWAGSEASVVVSSASSSGVAASGTGTSQVSATGSAVYESIAGISTEFGPRVTNLLRAADERVFPNEARLTLRFPGGDESAEELVPDELIAEVVLPLELPDRDPLEAFTFVGAPDLLPMSATRDGSARHHSNVETERTPQTIPQRRTTLPPRSLAPSELGAQEGTLTAEGGLSLAWRLFDRGEAVEVTMEAPGATTVRLGLLHGEVYSFAGGAYLAAAQALRKVRALPIYPVDEQSAIDVLREAVDAGQLDAFELDRALRVSRERLIQWVFTTPGVKFSIRQGTVGGDNSPLVHRSFIETVAEGARRRLRASEAERYLGLDLSATYTLGPSYYARAKDAGLEPELVSAIARGSGRTTLGELFTGVAASVGLPGAFYLLAVTEGLQVNEGLGSPLLSGAKIRDFLQRCHAQAEDSSYFELLGLDEEATARDVDEAYARRAEELRRLELGLLQLEELEPLRAQALHALEDARSVLRDPKLRAAYAAALRA